MLASGRRMLPSGSLLALLSLSLGSSHGLPVSTGAPFAQGTMLGASPSFYGLVYSPYRGRRSIFFGRGRHVDMPCGACKTKKSIARKRGGP